MVRTCMRDGTLLESPAALYRTSELARGGVFFDWAFTFGMVIAVVSRASALVALDSILVLDSETQAMGWLYASDVKIISDE